MRELLVFLLMAGCHVGAGPVVAYSPRGIVRVGFEASGGAGPLRGSAGGTTGLFGGVTRRYVTAEPGVALPYWDEPDDGRDAFRESVWPGAGATIGYSSSETSEHFASGIWASASYTHRCDRGENGFVGSLAIGVRVLADVWELYATPKIGVTFNCLKD